MKLISEKLSDSLQTYARKLAHQIRKNQNFLTRSLTVNKGKREIKSFLTIGA